MYLSAGDYFLWAKLLHFEKNTGIYRRLDNINVKKQSEKEKKLN